MTDATRVTVDAARCCGSGVCRTLCPEIFESDARGHARIRPETVGAAALPDLRAAVFACPHQAIALPDDEFFDFPDVGP